MSISSSTTPRSPEFALLGLLYEGEGYGYELHQRLVANLGHIWRLSQSQAYNILKRLVKLGYAFSQTQEQDKLPARQILRITDAGRRRFENWLFAPTKSSVHAIRLEFLTRMYFIQRLAPEKIHDIFEAQTESITETSNRLEVSQALLPSEQTFNRLSLQLRIHLLQSMLDWLDECRKTIEPIS